MESGIVAVGVIASGMMWSWKVVLTSATLIALAGLPAVGKASAAPEPAKSESAEKTTGILEEDASPKSPRFVAGSICSVTLTHPLFLGHHGDKVIAELGPELSYTLRVEHTERWLVSLANGKLGFTLKADLATKAACVLPKQSRTEPDEPAPATVQPTLDAADITEVTEALELTKALADGVEIDADVVAEQLAKVEHAANAREEARQAEGVVVTKGLIRVAVYDLQLVNVAAGLGSATTEALLQEVPSLKVFQLSAWMRFERCSILKRNGKHSVWSVRPMMRVLRR